MRPISSASTITIASNCECWSSGTASGVALTVDSLADGDIRSGEAIAYISELQPDMVIKDSEAASRP
jgi:hypothetical protein